MNKYVGKKSAKLNDYFCIEITKLNQIGTMPGWVLPLLVNQLQKWPLPATFFPL